MKTLHYSWNREKVYLPTDKPGVFNFRLVYVCSILNLIVNVWKEGYWHWIVIGYTSAEPLTPILVKAGGGPTKNEAQHRAEMVLINAGYKPQGEPWWQEDA
jgi:hypothetical protein